MGGELALGATVGDLVPGNPDDLERLVARCTTLARGLDAAADRIRSIRAGEWIGPAGDAFRQVVEDEPGRYAAAAEAFAGTAAAVASYRLTLLDALGSARRALAIFDDAEVATVTWRRQEEPAPVDPGTEGRNRARAVLDDARARVRAAGERAARRTEAAWADAPREPHWWESAGHFVAEIGRGAWESTVGLVEFAWSISTVRMMVDPQGWERDGTALGEGLGYGATHPVEFGKAILDWDTWQESPGRAIGHLVPDLLITLATAGGGAAARGARAVEAADELAEMGLTLRRLDRIHDASQRLTFLERARQLLPGRERPLPPPNVPVGSPAGRAAASQGHGAYPGVDDWYNVRAGAGDEFAAGSVSAMPDLPFSGFAVPRSVADDVGGKARELFEGVQVKPHEGVYRDEVTIFRAREELEVAVAIARNNPLWGPGGLRQVFIPDMQRLIDDGILEVTERRALHTVEARIHVDAAPAP
ncbi:MAG: putative T7SS-secreted protein [Sporichthyaceae bacterium]